MRSLLAHDASASGPVTRLTGARRGQGRLVLALVIGWLALIAAGGWLLAHSQATSRNGMAARLQTRVQFAAGFVSIYANDLLTSQRAQALTWFAGPAISQDTLDRDATALGLRAAAVLDTNGRVIRAAASAPSPLVGMLADKYSGLAATFAEPDESGVGLADVGGTPMLSFAVAYQTPFGRRVFTGAYTMAESVLPTVLGSVLSNSRLAGLSRRSERWAAERGSVRRAAARNARPGRPPAVKRRRPRGQRVVREPAGQAVLRHGARRRDLVADRAA